MILLCNLPAVSIKIFVAVITIPTIDTVFITISHFLAADWTIVLHHYYSNSFRFDISLQLIILKGLRWIFYLIPGAIETCIRMDRTALEIILW